MDIIIYGVTSVPIGVDSFGYELVGLLVLKAFLDPMNREMVRCEATDNSTKCRQNGCCK